MRTDQDAGAMQAALDALRHGVPSGCFNDAGRWYFRHGVVDYEVPEHAYKLEAIAQLEAALAQPVLCTCAGCSKKASDGWALYCVDCCEEIQPSLERGIRMGLDAAATVTDGANNYDNPMTANDCSDAIRALDPATIVEGK